jgi:Uma2 family endonuclease
MATVIEASELNSSAQLVRLPEHYEIVHGEIVELPPMSDYAGEVNSFLSRAVGNYLDSNNLGLCLVEILFKIPLTNDRTRNRRPDLAFVSYERWPRNRLRRYDGNARDVVPDLVAEVVSPGDSADDLIAKAREYLQGGVRLVWLVYPLAQEIHVYRPGAREVRVYFTSDELDAGEILPGFRTPVADLFPPLESRPDQPDPAA